MREVSIVVTTFERPESLAFCLSSIRKFYEDVEIVVVNNGNLSESVETTSQKNKAILINLPFDSGVSKSRNEGINFSKKKYTVCCDDDYGFTEMTRLEKFKTVLERDEAVGLVAGDVMSAEVAGPRVSRLVVNEKLKIFYLVPLKSPEMREVDGVCYYYADHVPQFFMMRNVPELRWDEDLKCQYEHIEFSLRVKREKKWKMAFTSEVSALHLRERPSEVYQKFRTRQDDWERFYRKTGYVDNISGVEKPEYDSNGRKLLPFPEYVFFLMKNKNLADAERQIQRPERGGQNG
jgi:glycosyltransferase involved in cell wall biosynthesis